MCVPSHGRFAVTWGRVSSVRREYAPLPGYLPTYEHLPFQGGRAAHIKILPAGFVTASAPLLQHHVLRPRLHKPRRIASLFDPSTIPSFYSVAPSILSLALESFSRFVFSVTCSCKWRSTCWFCCLPPPPIRPLLHDHLFPLPPPAPGFAIGH